MQKKNMLHTNLKKTVLIVEDNLLLSQMQKDWLKADGYEVITAINEFAARSLIKKRNIDLILSDVRLPEGNGIELLEWINKNSIHIPFVIMTEYASYPDAVRAVKLGATDYLPKPIDKERLLGIIHEILQTSSAIRFSSPTLFRRKSEKIRKIEKIISLAAPSDISVLILGNNGTGKESIAQSIHCKSNRKDMPFVAVNCGAIPKELASSFFFGHVKGAFTGAETDRPGYFTMAQGGTLFLDEIGNLTYDIQSMLLRVLQEKIFSPTGSHKEYKADIRIVAATNENLYQAIAEKRFREDLFHRLNELEIKLPSLSECPEDILPLANFFRDLYSKDFKRENTGFTEDTERLLLSYKWPGNIRELQHKVKRAVLLSERSLISSEDLGLDISDSSLLSFDHSSNETFDKQKKEEHEKRQIMHALEMAKGNLSQAAILLHISRPTLYVKLEKYNLR